MTRASMLVVCLSLCLACHEKMATVSGNVRWLSGGMPNVPVRVTAVLADSLPENYGVVSADADSSGRYVLQLPPGKFNISARVKGTVYGYVSTGGTVIEVKAGHAVTLPLRLLHDANDYGLSVQVVNADGTPNVSPLISVIVPEAGLRIFRADDAGKFTLPMAKTLTQSEIVIMASNGVKVGHAYTNGSARSVTIRLSE